MINNELYLGAQCPIDNGDELDGMLGCVTLKTSHTNIKPARSSAGMPLSRLP